MDPFPDIIDDRDGAEALVQRILDPHRRGPIVAVTLSEIRNSPLVDVAALQAKLGAVADIVVVRTGQATWWLKRRLPFGLDVYGDAIRAWRPGSLLVGEHPLLVLEDQPGHVDLSAMAPRLAAELSCREESAVVHSVSSDGALLELADFSLVVVEPLNVSATELSPQRVLRPAQRVRVLVITSPVEDAPAQGTLLPFEDDPAHRVSELLRPGLPILAKVGAITKKNGIDIELLPGVHGRIPPESIRAGTPWIDSELLAVELDPDRRRSRTAGSGAPSTDIRLREHRGDSQVRALSLRPDGPPWLQEAPVVVELSAAPDSWSRTSAIAKDEQDPADLAELILRAESAHEQSRDLIRGLGDSLDQMRSQARALRQELELDLAEIRHRVLATIESEHDSLTGSTLEALEEARAEISELRSALRESEQSRDRLHHEVSTLNRAEKKHKDELAKAKESIRLERARMRRLQRELDAFVPEKERFLKAVRESWLRQTDKDVRETYPWREPLIGEAFLESLDRVQGVTTERIIDVCAEVVSGRAVQRNGFQVHPLRSSSGGGGSAQLVRADGARAFRASLQVRSAAARRLHYWQLPDGRIELAQIGYHDDFGIR